MHELERLYHIHCAINPQECFPNYFNHAIGDESNKLNIIILLLCSGIGE